MARSSGHDLQLDCLQFLEVELPTGDVTVPRFLVDCFEFLSRHYDVEGIFRIPGSRARTQGLKTMLSTGLHDGNILVEHAELRVHDVADLIKIFLRQLNEPVIPYGLQQFLLGSVKFPKREEVILNLCFLLPRQHLDMLRFLTFELYKLAQHSQSNKMDERNLALIFALNVFRPEDSGDSILPGGEPLSSSSSGAGVGSDAIVVCDLQSRVQAMEILIRNAARVGVPSEYDSIMSPSMYADLLQPRQKAAADLRKHNSDAGGGLQCNGDQRFNGPKRTKTRNRIMRGIQRLVTVNEAEATETPTRRSRSQGPRTSLRLKRKSTPVMDGTSLSPQDEGKVKESQSLEELNSPDLDKRSQKRRSFSRKVLQKLSTNNSTKTKPSKPSPDLTAGSNGRKRQSLSPQDVPKSTGQPGRKTEGQLTVVCGNLPQTNSSIAKGLKPPFSGNDLDEDRRKKVVGSPKKAVRVVNATTSSKVTTGKPVIGNSRPTEQSRCAGNSNNGAAGKRAALLPSQDLSDISLSGSVSSATQDDVENVANADNNSSLPIAPVPLSIAFQMSASMLAPPAISESLLDKCSVTDTSSSPERQKRRRLVVAERGDSPQRGAERRTGDDSGQDSILEVTLPKNASAAVASVMIGTADGAVSSCYLLRSQSDPLRREQARTSPADKGIGGTVAANELMTDEIDKNRSHSDSNFLAPHTRNRNRRRKSSSSGRGVRHRRPTTPHRRTRLRRGKPNTLRSGLAASSLSYGSQGGDSGGPLASRKTLKTPVVERKNRPYLSVPVSPLSSFAMTPSPVSILKTSATPESVSAGSSILQVTPGQDPAAALAVMIPPAASPFRSSRLLAPTASPARISGQRRSRSHDVMETEPLSPCLQPRVLIPSCSSPPSPNTTSQLLRSAEKAKNRRLRSRHITSPLAGHHTPDGNHSQVISIDQMLSDLRASSSILMSDSVFTNATPSEAAYHISNAEFEDSNARRDFIQSQRTPSLYPGPVSDSARPSLAFLKSQRQGYVKVTLQDLIRVPPCH